MRHNQIRVTALHELRMEPRDVWLVDDNGARQVAADGVLVPKLVDAPVPDVSEVARWRVAAMRQPPIDEFGRPDVDAIPKREQGARAHELSSVDEHGRRRRSPDQ